MGKGNAQKHRNKVREGQPSEASKGNVIEVCEWNLRRKGGGQFIIQGKLSGDPTGQTWCSSAIKKRIDAKSFLTMSNKIYKLIGDINKNVAEEDGWPHHLVMRFSKAIPFSWQYLLNLCGSSNSTFGRSFEETYIMRTKSGSGTKKTQKKMKEAQLNVEDSLRDSMHRAAAVIIKRNVTSLKNKGDNLAECDISAISHSHLGSPDEICDLGKLCSPLHSTAKKQNCRMASPKRISVSSVKSRLPKRPAETSHGDETIIGNSSFDGIPDKNSMIIMSPMVVDQSARKVKSRIGSQMVRVKECSVVLEDFCKTRRKEPNVKNVTRKSTKKPTKSLPSAPVKSQQMRSPVAAKRKQVNTDTMFANFEAIRSKRSTTLKHKQEIREFLEQCNRDNSDGDLFGGQLQNTGSLNNVVNNFCVRDDISVTTDMSSSTDDGMPKRQNLVLTPLSDKAASTARSASPAYFHVVNRRHVDKYLLQRKAEQKLNAKKPVIPKMVTVKKKPTRDVLSVSLEKLIIRSVNKVNDEESMETSCDEF